MKTPRFIENQKGTLNAVPQPSKLILVVMVLSSLTIMSLLVWSLFAGHPDSSSAGVESVAPAPKVTESPAPMYSSEASGGDILPAPAVTESATTTPTTTPAPLPDVAESPGVDTWIALCPSSVSFADVLDALGSGDCDIRPVPTVTELPAPAPKVTESPAPVLAPLYQGLENAKKSNGTAPGGPAPVVTNSPAPVPMAKSGGAAPSEASGGDILPAPAVTESATTTPTTTTTPAPLPDVAESPGVDTWIALCPSSVVLVDALGSPDCALQVIKGLHTVARPWSGLVTYVWLVPAGYHLTDPLDGNAALSTLMGGE
ncbi:hypothetical protein JOE65_001696 [Arthrobacter roseus]|nr:hypothetical protein [Arthrobacter roseus]